MNTGLKTAFAGKKFQFTIFLLSFLIPTLGSAAIYKWVDEHGKTHYGSKRPSSSQAEKLDIKVRKSVVPQKKEAKKATEGQADPKDQNRQQISEPEQPKMSLKKRQQLCNQAKVEVQRIEARGRIRERDAKGEVRYLSPAERSRRLMAAKNDVKTFCK